MLEVSFAKIRDRWRKSLNVSQNLKYKMNWDLQSKTLYSLGIQENTDQKKFRVRALLTVYSSHYYQYSSKLSGSFKLIQRITWGLKFVTKIARKKMFRLMKSRLTGIWFLQCSYYRLHLIFLSGNKAMSKVLLYFVTNEAPRLIVADKIRAILLMYGNTKT